MKKNKLVNSFWDFIKRPMLASIVLIPPVLGIRAYNEGNSVESEIFNFRYHGMEAKIMDVDYPLADNTMHILFEDGSNINRGRLISDSGDIISILDYEYFINGVEQR